MNTPRRPRIAFVQSCWHEAIVDRCRASFVEEVAGLGIPLDRVDLYKVPGSFELPLHAKRLARSGRYSAVVAAGLIVDGGIYRHEFVAEAVINGLMRVQLDVDVPVISAVLTPHHFHEHEQHALFFAAHLEMKGREAARACTNTMRSLATLGEPAVSLPDRVLSDDRSPPPIPRGSFGWDRLWRGHSCRGPRPSGTHAGSISKNWSTRPSKATAKGVHSCSAPPGPVGRMTTSMVESSIRSRNPCPCPNESVAIEN